MQKVLIHANNPLGFFTSGGRIGIQLPIDPLNVFGLTAQRVAMGECEVPIGILSPLDHGYVAQSLTLLLEDLYQHGYPPYQLVRRGTPLKYEFFHAGKSMMLDHQRIKPQHVPKITWQMAIDAAILSYHSDSVAVLALFDLIRPSVSPDEWAKKINQHGWIQEN